MEKVCLNKQAVASNFSKAAANYDDFAFIQREIGDRLFERLELMRISPDLIVDVGCGTGNYTRKLKERFKKSKVYGVDIAEGMILQAERFQGWFDKVKYQVADMDELPFEDQSVDLLFSNLALQWSENLDKTFQEFARVIKPSGLILFTTLGPDTLTELKQAWHSVDDKNHVNDFIDMHDIGDVMIRSGIAQPVMDMEKLTFTYESVKAVVQDLKGIGAQNVNQDRHSGLMSKGKWQSMIDCYRNNFSQNNLFPATYEAIYGHGWGAKAKNHSSSDTFKISIS
ncbi:malonyl-ACP O-methyltransferase BioC [Pleionea sediminis]|uniref:malonyl-ACP O-methyltransferase BioC n=1 Tax=Pleionea sediminis TaxID=2569479 RepID=UPI001187158C|nr:malonyl-ACP O-methyltransferase BioC [Pleionea sediminis]